MSELNLDQPLSNKDYDRLEELLNQDKAVEDYIGVDELNGFLTAVVCSPETILPGEWLPSPYVMGDTEFESPEQTQEAVDLIIRMYNEIINELSSDEYLPIYSYYQEDDNEITEDVYGWCLGFLYGTGLREEIWNAHLELEDQELKTLLSLFIVQVTEDDTFEEDGVKFTEESKKALADLIPIAVSGIYQYWQYDPKESVSKAKPEKIYQIKVTLKGLKPPIWRRIQVGDNIMLSQLHEILQIVMDWDDCHLHEFNIQGVIYGVPADDYVYNCEDDSSLQLNKVLPAEGNKFTYRYDFGDNWTHELLVEKIIPPQEEVYYPRCIKGRRSSPPEDVGGTIGYKHFLEAIQDPENDEHENYLDWIGGEFNPEFFDLESVNTILEFIYGKRSQPPVADQPDC